MARSNGIRPTNTGSRKRLIQPVLPALPLIPKAKKGPIKAKEEDITVVNGTIPELQDAADLEVDSQLSPLVNEVANLQHPANGSSVPPESLHIAETSEFRPLPADLQLSQPQEQLVNRVANPDDSEPFQPVLEVDEGELKSKAFENEIASPAEGLSNSPDGTTSPANRLHQDRLDGETTEASDENPGYRVLVNTDAAPEAVTGNVEKPPPAYHSARPSISNSSFLHTPNDENVVPISPESAEYPQQQGVVNDRIKNSLASVVNGHDSPATLSDTANGVTMSPTGPPSFPTILDHVRNLQYLPEWSDCEICVYTSQSSKPAMYRNAHSFVLIRSERLRNFVFSQRAGSYTYYIINLAPVRPIDSNAFDAALRFLYADTVLAADRLLPPYVGLDKAGRAGAFDYVMSYMVAGLELGLEPVTTRSLDLIGRLLDWDIAELAVKEASLLMSCSAPAINPHAPLDALPAARSILQHVFNLIILRLDVKQFKIDTVATPVDLISRFNHFEPGRSAVNPALANMVFGSMPVSANLSPNLTEEVTTQAAISSETVASNIMLNIDFEALSDLASGLKNVHGEDGMRIIREVVEERERRRLTILINRSIPSKQRMSNSSTWNVIGWREHISEGTLQRDRVGFLLPSKRNGTN